MASVGSAPTYPVRVRLEEEDADLRPGMAAEVAIRATSGSDRILVPPVAVVEDRRGRFVFVVETGAAGVGVARCREVTVGDLRGDGLEIVSGLAAGDLLITAGARRLEDGTEVLLPADAGAGPGGSGA